MSEYILLRHRDDPGISRLDAYRQAGGFEAFKKVVTRMQPVDVINEVKNSGLRGRGGAGFPTGVKWSFLPTTLWPHYVVCNADESEPGTFKDREILENNPFQFLEGLMIASYAVQANLSYVYLRGEFWQVAKTLDEKTAELETAGMLGDNLFGTNYALRLHTHLGAGAYICGEETALLESLEGKPGKPRLRPPFPVVSGLYGKPTLINNVETLTNVPLILERGAAWHKSLGTEKSPGVKIFSLSGNVNRPGNYELPLGTTFRELIYTHGGGIPGGKAVKAIMPAGASSAIIHVKEDSLLDTGMDFESLTAIGSQLGPASVIVIDETVNMAWLANKTVSFFKHESCGKCTPCRNGTRILSDTLERIDQGDGELVDLEVLRRASLTMARTSLCGLGQASANPVVGGLRDFRSEYETQIDSKIFFQGNIQGHHPIGAQLGQRPVKTLIDPGRMAQAGRIDVRQAHNSSSASTLGLSLTINGNRLIAQPGQTILNVARANDIYIPTLCDYPGLPAYGSCRMCIVDVQGRPNPATACTTQVEEGMVVETDTARILELREDLLRMLLAEHPGGCLFCPENRHCQECMVTLRKVGMTTGCRSCPADRQCALQDLVERSGLQSVAYPVRYRSLRVEKEDPFFDRDYNLCVLCGRCIRVCESLHFANIPTWVKRGSETRVGTSLGQSHLAAGCSFCGACVEACPTGSLIEKTRKWDGRPDGETSSTCPFCSLGCEIRLVRKNGMVIGSLPGEDAPVLCVKGRFGVTEMVNHPDRMKRILHIENGESVRSVWEDAVQLAANRLADCKPGDFAMVVSASCSNEDLFVARKFAREVMDGAPLYLDSGARYGVGLSAVSRLMARSQPLEALDHADLIFCLGLDAKYAQSVVEVRLKRAKERGAKLLTLNASEHVPGRFSDLWIKPQVNEEEMTIRELAAGDGDRDQVGEIAEARNLIHSAQNPILVVGPDFLVRMPQAIERFHAVLGAALILLPAEGNLAGALKFGLGSAPSAGLPRVLYLVGSSIPLELDADTFVIFQNTHMPDLQTVHGLCDGLFLPTAAFTEVDGSILDQSGRVKRQSAAVAPPEDALPGWEILSRIAQAMGKAGFDDPSFDKMESVMTAETEREFVTVPPPSWLAVPQEHDFLGLGLAGWVDGLKVLEPFLEKEGQNVPSD